MLAVTAAMLVAAINYGNNLIFLLAFTMLALIVNSAWQGWRALGSLRIVSPSPDMRPAGSTGHWPLRLSSRDGLPAVDLSLDDDSSTPVSLPPGDTTTVALTLPPAPRGYLPLPEVTIASRFPLGLWEIERRVIPGRGQWLYPTPVEDSSQEVRPEDRSTTGSRHEPDGDPTHLRAYQPGDPLRRIVFRHYAKTGRLVSRQTEGEAPPREPTVIDYDRYRGPRETRLSAMTARLLQLTDAGEPWTIRLPGIRPISAGGHGDEARRARRDALRQLARFGRPRDAAGFDHVPVGTEELP
ncbi:hypothetical protein AUR63_06245 [Guyparkeria sp. XI15]|nr:hypothetical protein AUR63_06245 [Guyparkeria sp. XI15]OAE84663.1 hypothetical protein AWR35_06255 [Guyparkeria sp. WRN-7]